MCGIAGYLGTVDAAAPERVRRMLIAQRHRGPDGAGLATCGTDLAWQSDFVPEPAALHARTDSAVHCVFGHNLLAIQDRRKGGRQPMIAGEMALTFNGEIYNFVELRQKLQRDGVQFHSQSDTEVLLELWKREGPDCLTNLRGMFAFAVYDRGRDIFWAVRDPFGIKPLYFTKTGGALHFASEIRAFHAAGVVPRALRPNAAVACAAAGINSFGQGQTLYEQIEELPAGHILEISGVKGGTPPSSGSPSSAYYTLPDPSTELEGAAAIAGLRQAVTTSIRLHLRARRRIATCLSGGLDSSTIALLVARELGAAAGEFQTFTICTSGPQDSELELAALVAGAAGLRHVVVQPQAITPADVLEMVVAYESPNHVIGPINQFLLLREIARSGVTVVLDGQGGDELLSGYPWFIPVLLPAIAQRGDVWAIEQGLKQRLPYPAETMAAFTSMFHDPREWVKAFMWQGQFLGWSMDQVLALPETQYYLEGGGDWAAFRRREYFRAELQYLLRQEDRLGMWFGLECRVPLVDAPLVQVASQIVPELLVQDGYLKCPFRLMLPELPDQVRWNTAKRGFWEVDRGKFPWVKAFGRQLTCESRFLRELFRGLEREWDNLNFDQQWRLLQLAVLERCATREEIAGLQ